MATSKKKPKKMGDDAALLAAILARPDDLELRFVYADSLSERGDPRGRFIAEQCALSKLDSLDRQYAVLLASTRRLIATHATEWLGDYAKKNASLAEAPGRTPIDRHLNASFENGFLRSVAVEPSKISKDWAALRAREPITGMQLLVGEALDAAHHELKEPKVLTSLKVSPESWFTANSVGNVLAWGMPELRDIDLSGCDAGPTACHFFANLDTDLAESFTDFVPPPKFAAGQLQRLVLRNCNILDRGAEILFAAENLAGLRELDLGQCKMTQTSTLAALKKSAAMTSLRRLGLAGNNQLDVAALAGWAPLPELEQLALPQSTTAAALKKLFPKPSKMLRELGLASAKELLKTPEAIVGCAESLTELDIGTSGVGDDAVAALVESPLERLVTLDLSSNKLTDKGLQALAEWPGLAQITHLRLGNNRKLGLPGYRALMDASDFHPAELDVGKAKEAKALRERFGEAVLSA
jgi:uncharacterized protein (TIGR02996 family)